MAEFDFENLTFDPDGPEIDDDYSLDLPDAIMDPLPPRVQQELNTSGDNILTLRGEVREVELEAQKKGLVDTFYKEVNCAYGLHPDSNDYDQFRIDDGGKTLYWTPGNKTISISTTRRSLGLTGCTRKGLGSSAEKALQQADKTLLSNLDNIKLEDLPGIADSALQSAEQVETTIDDQSTPCGSPKPEESWLGSKSGLLPRDGTGFDAQKQFLADIEDLIASPVEAPVASLAIRKHCSIHPHPWTSCLGLDSICRRATWHSIRAISRGITTRSR